MEAVKQALAYARAHVDVVDAKEQGQVTLVQAGRGAITVKLVGFKKWAGTYGADSFEGPKAEAILWAVEQLTQQADTGLLDKLVVSYRRLTCT